MTVTDFIFGVLVALIGQGGFWKYAQYRAERRAKNKKCTLEDLGNKIDKFSEDLKSNTELTVAHARKSLNNDCIRFIQLGYIPMDEYVSFKLLGDEYCKNHNSEVKERYKWCIANLKPKDNN